METSSDEFGTAPSEFPRAIIEYQSIRNLQEIDAFLHNNFQLIAMEIDSFMVAPGGRTVGDLSEYLVLNELTPRDQGRANVMVDISRQGLYDRQNDPRYNAWYFSQN